MREANMARGIAFEASLVSSLSSSLPRGSLIDCSNDRTREAGSRSSGSDGKLLQESARRLLTAPVGAILYQPVFELPASFYSQSIARELQRQGVEFSVFRPDFIRVEAAANGKRSLFIIDAKASNAMKLSHQVQVTLYALFLDFILRDLAEQGDERDSAAVNSLSIASDGGVWLPQAAEPERFPLALTKPLVSEFVFASLPEIVSKGLTGAEWHFCANVCNLCDYSDRCRQDAIAQKTLSNVPYLSKRDFRWLKRVMTSSGIEAHPLTASPASSTAASAQQALDFDMEDLAKMLAKTEPGQSEAASPAARRLHRILKARFAQPSSQLQPQLQLQSQSQSLLLESTAEASQQQPRLISPFIEGFRSRQLQLLGGVSSALPSSEDVAIFVSCLLDPQQSKQHAQAAYAWAIHCFDNSSGNNASVHSLSSSSGSNTSAASSPSSQQQQQQLLWPEKPSSVAGECLPSPADIAAARASSSDDKSNVNNSSNNGGSLADEDAANAAERARKFRNHFVESFYRTLKALDPQRTTWTSRRRVCVYFLDASERSLAYDLLLAALLDESNDASSAADDEDEDEASTAATEDDESEGKADSKRDSAAPASAAATAKSAEEKQPSLASMATSCLLTIVQDASVLHDRVLPDLLGMQRTPAKKSTASAASPGSAGDGNSESSATAACDSTNAKDPATAAAPAVDFSLASTMTWTALKSRRIAELREMCDKLGISREGLKDVLAERIRRVQLRNELLKRGLSIVGFESKTLAVLESAYKHSATIDNKASAAEKAELFKPRVAVLSESVRSLFALPVPGFYRYSDCVRSLCPHLPLPSTSSLPTEPSAPAAKVDKTAETVEQAGKLKAKGKSKPKPIDSLGEIDFNQRIGKYHPIAAIGRGSVGDVIRAIDFDTFQVVAIKRIPLQGLSPDGIEILESEHRFLRNLSHPNIVRYLGAIRGDNCLYIVTEFVDNGTINQFLSKLDQRRPEQLVAKWIKDALAGLHYLHKRAVAVHMLKAGNLLLTHEGTVKLVDYGMQTSADQVIGSPYHMAPEVIEMIQTPNQSAAADIWAIGCTVIELLTGKPPYFDLPPRQAQFRIVQDEHPPLPENVSSACEDFLRQCFQRDPARRIDAATLLEHAWLNPIVKAKEGSAADKLSGSKPSPAPDKSLTSSFAQLSLGDSKADSSPDEQTATANEDDAFASYDADQVYAQWQQQGMARVKLLLNARLIAAQVLLRQIRALLERDVRTQQQARQADEKEKTAATPSSSPTAKPRSFASQQQRQQPLDLALLEPAAKFAMLPAVPLRHPLLAKLAFLSQLDALAESEQIRTPRTASFPGPAAASRFLPVQCSSPSSAPSLPGAACSAAAAASSAAPDATAAAAAPTPAASSTAGAFSAVGHESTSRVKGRTSAREL